MPWAFPRILLGVFGGYACTSATTVFVAAVIPLPRPQAVLAATLGSFPLFVAILLMTFALQRIARLALAMAGVTLLLGSVGLVLTRNGL